MKELEFKAIFQTLINHYPYMTNLFTTDVLKDWYNTLQGMSAKDFQTIVATYVLTEPKAPTSIVDLLAPTKKLLTINRNIKVNPLKSINKIINFFSEKNDVSKLPPAETYALKQVGLWGYGEIYQDTDVIYDLRDDSYTRNKFCEALKEYQDKEMTLKMNLVLNGTATLNQLTNGDIEIKELEYGKKN